MEPIATKRGNRRLRLPLGACALLGAVCLVGSARAAPAPAKKAKYYFNIVDVKSVVTVDDGLKAAAREALQKELQSRPEFTSDLGAAGGDEAVAELKRRKLQGFNVTLK